MKQIAIATVLLLFSYTLAAQCYENNTVQINSADLDCTDNVASLVVELNAGSNAGNACVIFTYTQPSLSGPEVVTREFGGLTGVVDITLNNVICDQPITMVPKTAPNCNGSQCGPDITYPSVTAFISETLVPIELHFFTAEAKGGSKVQLSWATSSEVDNDYFNIERKISGENWESIGVVNGSGNSNSLIEYDFLDRDPYEGLNYYRLIDVDYSGNQSISKVQVVDLRGDSNTFGIRPNPVNKYFDIDVVPDNSIIEIIALDGRRLYFELLQNAENDYRVDVEFLSKGIYFVKISNENLSFSKRIVKY